MDKLYIVICWSKQALIGVYVNQEIATKIANDYSDLHKCGVTIHGELTDKRVAVKITNPCLKCYFDWKDFCSAEKRKECSKKQGGKK